MNLSQLKIIVTGAAQGMGAHFARRLAEAGAQVAAGDVKEEGLAALAEATRGLPGLINNAGILRDGLLVKKDRTTGEITKLSKENWDAVLGVNLTGATFMV